MPSSLRLGLCRALVPLTHLAPRRALSTSHAVWSSPSLPNTSTQPLFFDRVALLGPDGKEYDRIPAFRVLDGEGKVLPEVEGEWLAALEGIPAEKLVKIYETMLLSPTLVSARAGLAMWGRGPKLIGPMWGRTRSWGLRRGKGASAFT